MRTEPDVWFGTKPAREPWLEEMAARRRALMRGHIVERMAPFDGFAAAMLDLSRAVVRGQRAVDGMVRRFGGDS